MAEEGQSDAVFRLLLHQNELEPTNLNEKFEKYKCHTLEAKVPVVEAGVSAQLKGSSKNVQLLNTLKLKARGPVSTKNARLKMVTINDDVVIEVTPQTREEEATKPELDADLEEYMIEARKIKKTKMSTNGLNDSEMLPALINGGDGGSTLSSKASDNSKALWTKKKDDRKRNDQNKPPADIDQSDLDAELEEYMRQKPSQKRKTALAMDVD